MKEERVNHPAHYNRHPSGVECIEVIRHYACDIANAMKYLWRAGLKGEADMTGREKEIEDCKKAIWYLHDFLEHGIGGRRYSSPLPSHPSGLECEAIASCYCDEIAQAFRGLWWVGLVIDGCVMKPHPRAEEEMVRSAIDYIWRHIANVG